MLQLSLLTCNSLKVPSQGWKLSHRLGDLCAAASLQATSVHEGPIPFLKGRGKGGGGGKGSNSLQNPGVRNTKAAACSSPQRQAPCSSNDRSYL